LDLVLRVLEGVNPGEAHVDVEAACELGEEAHAVGDVLLLVGAELLVALRERGRLVKHVLGQPRREVL